MVVSLLANQNVMPVLMRWTLIQFFFKVEDKKYYHFDQKSTSKHNFASYYLKLSLPMLLKRSLVFAKIEPFVSHRHVSHKKT